MYTALLPKLITYTPWSHKNILNLIRTKLIKYTLWIHTLTGATNKVHPVQLQTNVFLQLPNQLNKPVTNRTFLF